MNTVRIGLLWHSLRAGNLGVGALTAGNLALIREVAARLDLTCEFTVLTMRERATDPIDTAVGQFEIDTKTLLSPGGLAAEIGRQDFVVDIGAGDSFTDIYGPKRFGFLWLSKMQALASYKPLILAPQTIGPFSGKLYRRLAAHVMTRAEAVVARDRASLEAVRELAPGANAHLAVDVAFRLPFEDRSAQRGAGGARRIGFNVSGLLAHQAETGENRFGLSYDYLELNRRLIARYAADEACEVHLVTHANSIGDASDNDGAIADRLATEYPNAVRVPDFAGPSEAKSYISGLDFLVAGRMHACIAAFSSQTPVVPVSYSRKFSGLFDLLGYPHYMPITGITLDEAVDFVLKAEAARDELRRTETAALGKVDAMFDDYRAVLARTFAKVTGGRS